MPIAQAREAGAMMLFGEKYPDIVRMVSMGDFSKELCGGTHLDNTAQVGLFKVVGEESVSAGTRRITALTGSQALAHLARAEAALAETASLLRVPPAEVPARVAAMVKELRELKKHSSPKGAGEVSAEKLLAEAADVGGVRVVVAEAPGADAGMMRQLIDQLRKQASPIAVLLGSREADKVTLVAGISRDLEQRGLDAGNGFAGRPKRSAAAVAASPTWPRPAANIRKNCPRRWNSLARPRRPCWAASNVSRPARRADSGRFAQIVGISPVRPAFPVKLTLLLGRRCRYDPPLDWRRQRRAPAGVRQFVPVFIVLSG